ncbi:type II secretion system protein [bacterium]|nr:type II secretion system protein [bacterium]
MLNKKAFTLSELLIALAIVGAIAALSIPAVVEDMNRRILASQLKNVSLSIQQLAGEQLVKNRTKRLKYTDFATPATLLGASNFEIADNCTTKSNCVASTYSRINGENATFPANYVTRKLKNGVTIAYNLSTNTSITGDPDDKPFGIFYVDLNGVDHPNILGRDLFAFRISEKGRIFDGTGNNAQNDTNLKNWCVGQASSGYYTTCYTLVERNNWKITY